VTVEVQSSASGIAGRSATAKRILFVCGSINQTTQMQRIARELGEFQAAFTPFYGNPFDQFFIRAGLAEMTIAGRKLRSRCLSYLEREGLEIDLDGARGGYALCVTCSDVIVQNNLQAPIVLVQEGILDREGLLWPLLSRFPRRFPRWLAGTAATGLSLRYERFCVASDGYRDLFIHRGVPAERLVTTGIPNFDDCAAFHDNDFPHRHYVLVCTSDARETLKIDRRRRFIERAVRIAGGRQLIFKLHPNEAARSADEVRRWAPRALVYREGPTDAMIANCDVLVTQYSSTAFVGLALGKEVHSYFPIAELRRLLPVQNRCAARNIAAVCRELLQRAEPRHAPSLSSTVPSPAAHSPSPAAQSPSPAAHSPSLRIPPAALPPEAVQ
jgi:hypothetical protein